MGYAPSHMRDSGSTPWIVAILAALSACRQPPAPGPVDVGIDASGLPADPVTEEVTLRWQARVLASTHPAVTVGSACEFVGTSARTRGGRRPLWIRGTCAGSPVYEPFLEVLGSGPLDHSMQGRCQLRPAGDRFTLLCPPLGQQGPSGWSHRLEHLSGDIAVVTHLWQPRWTVRLHWQPMSDPPETPIDLTPRP